MEQMKPQPKPAVPFYTGHCRARFMTKAEYIRWVEMWRKHDEVTERMRERERCNYPRLQED